MNNPETPEQKADLPEARILWAASFLVDWLIPLLQEDRIHTSSDIQQLREGFPPLAPEDEKGTDFTLQDVLRAALRTDEFVQKQQRTDPGYTIDYAEELSQAIDLLSGLAYNRTKRDDAAPG